MRKIVLALFLLSACGKEPPPPPPPPPPPAKPKGPDKNLLIATAKKYDKKDYLYAGYATVLFIYYDGHEKSMKLLPFVEQVVAKHEKAVLRRVDILTWNTDAAAQAREEYKMGEVPLCVIFDGQGTVVQRVLGGDITEIETAIQKAVPK